MNQEIKYWKQRCEAAEKILQRQPPTNRMQFIPKSIYDEWQSLVNTPPSPEPVIREIGITQDAKPIMSASEFMLETHGNDYLQDGMYLDGRDILGFMEEYAKQFTPDPLVKESLTTDWDELRKKFITEMTGNYTGVQYMEVGDPDKIFNFFKTNIGGGK